MLRRVILPITLVLGASAQAQSPSASTTQRTFRISGTVVNALSGQSLAQTEVAIGRSGQPGILQSVVTGGSGRFDFGGVLAGKYFLVAEGKGFARQAFNEHEGFSTAIVAGPGLQSENLVFRLRPNASIGGTVTDEQGESVRDAQVMLFRGGVEYGQEATIPRGQVMTDDEGHYHFSHLAPGRYFVAVMARPWYAVYAQNQRRSLGVVDGVQQTDASPQPAEERSQLDVAYPTTFYAGATDSEGATPITLRPGDRFVADLTLSPVPALHLRVSNVSADPSESAGVSMSQRMFGGHVLTPIPAQNMRVGGVIEISGIPPGQYSVNLQSYGKEPSSRTRAVDVTEDAEIDAAEAAASPVISGLVKLDGTDSLPGSAYFALRNPASGESLGAQVSSKGEFQVQGSINPGNYEVSVFNMPGALVSSLSATGAKVNGQSVRISGSQAVRLTVVMSKRSVNVTGVALRNGKPFAGAMIVLVPQDAANNASLFRRDQSDSDGTFTLGRALPGKYTVVAIENGWDLPWLNPETLKSYMKNGEAVEIHPDGKYDIKIKVQ